MEPVAEGVPQSFENNHVLLGSEKRRYGRVQSQAVIDLALDAELRFGSVIRHGSLDDGLLGDEVNGARHAVGPRNSRETGGYRRSSSHGE